MNTNSIARYILNNLPKLSIKTCLSRTNNQEHVFRATNYPDKTFRRFSISNPLLYYFIGEGFFLRLNYIAELIKNRRITGFKLPDVNITVDAIKLRAHIAKRKKANGGFWRVLHSEKVEAFRIFLLKKNKLIVRFTKDLNTYGYSTTLHRLLLSPRRPTALDLVNFLSTRNYSVKKTFPKKFFIKYPSAVNSFKIITKEFLTNSVEFATTTCVSPRISSRQIMQFPLKTDLFFIYLSYVTFFKSAFSTNYIDRGAAHRVINGYSPTRYHTYQHLCSVDKNSLFYFLSPFIEKFFKKKYNMNAISNLMSLTSYYYTGFSINWSFINIHQSTTRNKYKYILQRIRNRRELRFLNLSRRGCYNFLVQLVIMKDPMAFIKVLQHIFFDNPVKKHRRLFLKIRFFLKVWYFICKKKKTLKGYSFFVKGKLGKKGSVKKRKIYIKKDLVSYTNKELRVNSKNFILWTDTGCIGANFSLFF